MTWRSLFPGLLALLWFGVFNTARACQFTGRLENLAFLTVVKADFLQVIHRELAQIDRPVLGIADFYPVVEDAQMVRTHRTYIDGLDTAYAAVVFDLYAGEVPQCVCYALYAELLQSFAGQPLDGHNVICLALCRYFDFLDSELSGDGVKK